MDRIPSDHPDVESVRCHVARHGGSRRRLEIPTRVLPDEATVRVVLDETVRFGAIVHQDSAESWLTGVFDSPRLARSGDGKDRLQSWFDRANRSVDTSVHVDVISDQYAIGLRAPGEHNVYPTVHSPGSSLDDIARSLADDS